MTREEARQVLLLYRPDSDDETDPQMAAALEMAKSDPELNRWLEEHLAFQTVVRNKLRSIPVPAHLKEAILGERKVVTAVPWWRNPVWMGAAALLIAMVTLTALLLGPTVPDRFADYRSRMVRTALREYRMDIVTNDMRQVRMFMATNGAPADYTITPRLAALPLTGGGLLKWRGHPVSMVCFDHGNNQMLFLFVMSRAAVMDPPPPTPEVERVNKLMTASWSAGDRTYILAGPPEVEIGRKYP
jgi:uncharacterized membrane protein YbaN (DUF454 family)